MAALRREHQAALARPMTGTPMRGDPKFNDAGGNYLLRRVCQYAAEMVRGRRGLPEDLSGFDAVYLEPATVLFIRADASQDEAARYTIPAHVLNFGRARPSPLLQAVPMTNEPGSMAERIVVALRRHRFHLVDEKRLQAEIAAVLDGEALAHEREVKLASGSVIDFLVGDVGLEVKIKGGKKSIYRQCERYCGFDQVKTLVLATNRSMGVPPAIGGKPVYVVSLGKAWL